MTAIQKQELISKLILIINEIPDDMKSEEISPKREEKVELLTARECLDCVDGLKYYTLRKLVEEGKIPHIRAGAGKSGKMLIPKAALLEYFTTGNRKYTVK